MVKIADNIFWVGAIDWDLRNFHGYLTPRGTTYNSYLIVDEKITLIDTVKGPFADELIARISSVISPDKIDYVISNHVEMDHSGSLSAIKKVAPNAKFISDKRAAQDLNRHFKKNWDFQIVKTGDTLSLGKRSLTFVEVPMVHWPDSMVTYCPEDKILFSNDAFGQHIATFERFDDEHDYVDLKQELMKYYANIVMPLSAPAGKALQTVGGLKVDVIAPSHGVVWRKHVNEIISCYKDWSINKTKNKAVVVYDTMWESTEKMALSIAEGLVAGGVETKIFNLRLSDVSEIVAEIQEARAIIVGSSTINNGMLGTVGGFLTYLKGLKPRGRIGFVFGSYGWSGGASKAMEAELTATGIEILRPSIDLKYIPDPSELSTCFTAGNEFAKVIHERSTK